MKDSPDGLIGTAARQVPAFRFAIGGAALLALASIVVKWGVNLPTLFLIAGVVLVGAMAFVALQWVTKLKAQKTHLMAAVLGWSLLGLLVLSLLMVFTSAVFNKPWSLQALIEKQISADEHKSDGGTAVEAIFLEKVAYQSTDFALSDFKAEDFIYTGGAQPRILDKSKVAEMLTLTELRFGEIDQKVLGFEVVFRFRNPGGSPMVLDVRREYFKLVDDLGRVAEIVGFSAPPPESVVGASQDRRIRVLFATPGWAGKQNASHEAYLEVNGFKPITHAEWKFRPMLAMAE